MIINSVALIAGALSFSAALAWNKAIGDSVYAITKSNSSVLQATVITIFIILLVGTINFFINRYTEKSGKPLNEKTLNAGTNPDSKVILFPSFIK